MVEVDNLNSGCPRKGAGRNRHLILFYLPTVENVKICSVHRLMNIELVDYPGDDYSGSAMVIG